MKKYLFNDDELEIIRLMKSDSPNKIWWNLNEYIFEYENFYIKLSIHSAEKMLVDELTEESVVHNDRGEYNIFWQYVMRTKLLKVYSRFIPKESMELLCSNEKIDDVKIVRTLLYFTKHRRIKDGLPHYKCDSSIINPNLQIDTKINVERTYLADVGLLLLLKNRYINCFIFENDDDFCRNVDCHGDNWMETKKELYEFIETE